MIWNSHTGIACNDGGSFVCSLWAFSADFRVLWVSPLGVLLSCRPPRPPVVSDNISLRYVMWEGKAASRPRATPATSPRNITHVLVHWESCLQGSEIPAAEPARADSDIRAITTITDSWLELACARAGVRYHPSRLPSLLAKRFFTSKRSLALLPDDTTCIRPGCPRFKFAAAGPIAGPSRVPEASSFKFPTFASSLAKSVRSKTISSGILASQFNHYRVFYRPSNWFKTTITGTPSLNLKVSKRIY